MSLLRGLSRGRFWPRVALLAAAWQALVFSVPVLAQRDPTLPPPAVAAPAASAASDVPAGLVLTPGAVSVLRRDGVSYLVLGTRVYAQGQSVGSTKIERISETEVWLLDNGTRRKMPLFEGIARHTAPASPAPGAPPPATPAKPAADWLAGPEFEL